jgi:hypothetical protein
VSYKRIKARKYLRGLSKSKKAKLLALKNKMTEEQKAKYASLIKGWLAKKRG